MNEKRNKHGILTESMLLVSLGFGAVYWIIDTILFALTSGDPALPPLAGLMNMQGIWQRLIVLSFFVIFGSHIQYNAKIRRESEAALREKEERYRKLVETSTDAIISVDDQMHVIQWNRAASELFGFSRELMIGKSVDALIPEKYRQRHQEGVRRFLATEKASLVGKAVEFEGLRKNGTTKRSWDTRASSGT